MTNKSDEGSFGPGAHDQRPQVTLELKATEVRSDPMPGEEATTAAADATASETVATPAPEADIPPRIESEAPPKPAKPLFSTASLNEANIQTFATHLAAGLTGSLLALIVAYYGAGAFRDRLPLLTERNAQDFQTRVAAYDARIAKQDERMAAMDKAAAALEKTIAAQRQELQQTQTRIQTLSDQQGLQKQELALLGRRVDERPAAVTNATPGASPEAVQQSVDPLKARIAELEARLGQVSKSQSETQTDGRASAIAVALYNLRRAVTDGKPFAAELQSISTLTPVPLELDALNASREKGVRSLQQLQTAFEPAANAAIDAESRAAETSWVGGVWSRMKSLVRIRRVGDVAGDDTQSVLARTEVKLNAGDLRAAIAEGSKLKDTAAASFRPWLEDAKARLAVEEAVTRAEAALLTALGIENKAKRGS